MSNNFLLVDSLTRDTLRECKHSYNNFFTCPTYMFVSEPVSEHLCEYHLIHSNGSSLADYCHFRELNISTFVHKLVHFQHFFHFVQKTDITLTCPNLPRAIRTSVQGAYVIADACEVRIKAYHLLPSHHHSVPNVSLFSEISPLEDFQWLESVNLSVRRSSQPLRFIHL